MHWPSSEVGLYYLLSMDHIYFIVEFIIIYSQKIMHYDITICNVIYIILSAMFSKFLPISAAIDRPK